MGPLLDTAICSQARKARDPRFDGRFFIAVLTTGIYCRPVCSVRQPKEENVRYFATAAAAAEAGFRPCLRCRPECSPGTPAWMGTSATVSRALRLIAESAMENSSVDEFAACLGIGARHLRRLFLQHLGAGPIAIMQTRRLHFAKKLLDETSLPMRDVALASGFGSVRRFNASFQKTYKRTPTQLRNFARRGPALPEHEHHFHLNFRPPFAWTALLDFLAPRAVPGVEAVSDGRYRRTFTLHGHAGWMEVAPGAAGGLLLRLRYPEPRWLFIIVERVRRMFDLAADPQEISSCLLKDPLLAPRVKGLPGLRVPGCFDGFELAVRAVLGQQVTVRGATTLSGRLVREFGTPITENTENNDGAYLFPGPETMARSDLVRIGLPRARAACLQSLAVAVRDGRLAFHDVTADQFLEDFRKLPGIGEWTAQYVAMRAFGEPNAFPSSDLGLLRAAGAAGPRQLEERAEAWRPWRAYAALYLWQGAPQDGKNKLHTDRKSHRAAAAGR